MKSPLWRPDSFLPSTSARAATTGQEVIARQVNYGKVARQLVGSSYQLVPIRIWPAGQCWLGPANELAS